MLCISHGEEATNKCFHEMQNVIITGRTMPKELEEIADTISEVRDERHAFRLGVKAQAGIEF